MCDLCTSIHRILIFLLSDTHIQHSLYCSTLKKHLLGSYHSRALPEALFQIVSDVAFLYITTSAIYDYITDSVQIDEGKIIRTIITNAVACIRWQVLCDESNFSGCQHNTALPRLVAELIRTS